MEIKLSLERENGERNPLSCLHSFVFWSFQSKKKSSTLERLNSSSGCWVVRNRNGSVNGRSVIKHLFKT